MAHWQWIMLSITVVLAGICLREAFIAAFKKPPIKMKLSKKEQLALKNRLLGMKTVRYKRLLEQDRLFPPHIRVIKKPLHFWEV